MKAYIKHGQRHTDKGTIYCNPMKQWSLQNTT